MTSSVSPAAALGDVVPRVAQLDRVAADALAAAFEAHSAPVRVQIAGRAGVGRTTVTTMLRNATPEPSRIDFVETSAFDSPATADPVLDADVLVYLLVDALRSADRRALETTTAASVVLVLNKADTLGSDTSEIGARIDECTRECGTKVYPLVATTAEGAEAVVDAVTAGVRSAEIARGGVLICELRRQAARSFAARDVIEQCVTSDAAVALEAGAARAELSELSGRAPGAPRTAEEALRNAQWWKGQATAGLPARQRRQILTVHRDYVRQWARLSGRARARGA
ncbi:hypothetical protein [Rhodococcus sp. NPDC058521]|uniref:hypothetical protein n=1 Tax=Rhodococcus sp. NPDC058521 TaxID=3346536 RepID=UPI00365A67C6